ncbi:DUF465 domain-containing protein [Paroceanicella profunda]|uniref:DUF465 domain-containing protein n=1 Tax=Paroceanicella profunda TaxID=2579971 RepID=A0A5B8FZP3_9RHOB|nr:DUF465 domain-containing protein [Paroceanicella profunda]QDL92142.1 DUF465 domain-containing protein [Paroceanicella profunda]
MSLSSHISQLQRKHETLSQRIEMEARSPSMDNLKLTELKREKLRLKEEISRLSVELH